MAWKSGIVESTGRGILLITLSEESHCWAISSGVAVVVTGARVS